MTMLRITLCTIAVLLTFVSNAQKDTTRAGIFTGAMATPRIIAARHEFNENNMRGAMLIYREVLQSDPNNAAALYGTSECYYNLKKYKLALEYLNKALEKEPAISSESEFSVDRFITEQRSSTMPLLPSTISFRKKNQTPTNMKSLPSTDCNACMHAT